MQMLPSDDERNSQCHPYLCQLHIDSFMEIIHYIATTVHAVGIKEADSVVSSCLCPQHSMNLGLSASLIYHISISCCLSLQQHSG